MMKSLLHVTLFGALAATFPAGQACAQDGPPKWSVGAIGAGYITPYEAEDNQLSIFPYVAYRGDRFFIDATRLGYRLIKPQEGAPLSFELDIIAAARMLPGESRDKVTADLGLEASLSGAFGLLSLTALHDVTDTHNGMELSANYEYDFNFDKLTISPSIGVMWQNRKLADHMWGVTEKQQDKMIEKGDPILPLYTVEKSAVNFTAGLTTTYNLNNRWTVIGFARGTYLDSSIRDNPGIDKKYDLSVGLGLAYNF